MDGIHGMPKGAGKTEGRAGRWGVGSYHRFCTFSGGTFIVRPRTGSPAGAPPDRITQPYTSLEATEEGAVPMGRRGRWPPESRKKRSSALAVEYMRSLWPSWSMSWTTTLGPGPPSPCHP